MALLVGDTLRQDDNNIYYPDNDNNFSDSWDEREGDVEDVLQGLYFLENFVKGASFQQHDDNNDRHNGEEEYNNEYELDCDYYAPYVTSLPPKPINTNSSYYDNEEGLTPDFWSDSLVDEIGIPTYTQRILDRKRILHTIAQDNNVDESDLQWATRR